MMDRTNSWTGTPASFCVRLKVKAIFKGAKCDAAQRWRGVNILDPCLRIAGAGPLRVFPALFPGIDEVGRAIEEIIEVQQDVFYGNEQKPSNTQKEKQGGVG